jgi:hypothetical protein
MRGSHIWHGVTKSESIAIRVTPAVKKAVARAARTRQQTIAAFIEDAIVSDLRKNGFLQEDPSKKSSTSEAPAHREQ